MKGCRMITNSWVPEIAWCIFSAFLIGLCYLMWRDSGRENEDDE